MFTDFEKSMLIVAADEQGLDIEALTEEEKRTLIDDMTNKAFELDQDG